MNAEYGFHSRALYGQVRHFKRLIMFQYTSTGVLSNYQPLDLSVFYGSKADFNKDCKDCKHCRKVRNTFYCSHLHKKIKHHDFGRKCDLEAIPLKEVKNDE